MIDMASVLSGVGGASLVQSLALMFARRWMGRIDDVERELKLVKETEMKQIDERLTAATASLLRSLYPDISMPWLGTTADDQTAVTPAEPAPPGS